MVAFLQGYKRALYPGDGSRFARSPFAWGFDPEMVASWALRSGVALSARMPELSALEVLSAIAKTGSLSAASREVGISQQAVSARLTSIESQIGVRLVTRTTRGTQLTPAGEVVAEWADQVLDVAQRVDTGLASLRAERRSRLKVAASQTVAEQLLPRWLVSLQAAAAAARRHRAGGQLQRNRQRGSNRRCARRGRQNLASSRFAAHFMGCAVALSGAMS